LEGVDLDRLGADLALRFAQLALFWWRRSRLQALATGGEEVLAPTGDPTGRLTALAGERVKRLAPEQAQHQLLLAARRPAHLPLAFGCALGALVVRGASIAR